MDKQLEGILVGLSGKRLAEVQNAFDALCARTKQFYADLIDLLARKKYDQSQYYVLGFGPVKQSVWRALLKRPTTKILKDLARLADYPNWQIRESFACDLAELGLKPALPLIARFLMDEEPMVRESAAAGLWFHARSCKSIPQAYRRAAAKLLIENFRRFPDDEGYQRHQALAILAPKAQATFEAELDRKNPIRVVWKRIDKIASRHRSYKDAASALARTRADFAWLFAIQHVDADLRNGGVYQLYGNSTWQLMLHAIGGAQAFGFSALSRTLKEILYYYHRNGRSKLARQTPVEFFDDLPRNWNKSLDKLEGQYYHCFHQLGAEDLSELELRILRTHPDLLDA